MSDRIVVVDYDPGWPDRFDAEAVRVRAALGEVAPRVEHVGSTAVPGLAAKPTVDIQVSVAALEPMTAYRGALERLGYEHMPDKEFPEHRFFGWPGGVQPRTFNMHVCEAGSDWERRHLAFRDVLRADPAVAQEYAALKRELALRHGNDVESYADAKTDFIKAHSA